MPSIRTFTFFHVLVILVLGSWTVCLAQSGGSSTSINGTVVDPSGAGVPNATVEIHNPVSQYQRSATSNDKGNFSFPNVPFNPYHMTVTAPGFAAYAQDLDVRSLVPLTVQISLRVTASSEV